MIRQTHWITQKFVWCNRASHMEGRKYLLYLTFLFHYAILIIYILPYILPISSIYFWITIHLLLLICILFLIYKLKDTPSEPI